MHDDAGITYQELIQENSSLKQRIQELESLTAELKRIEKGLRENEDRNQLLLSNTTDYVAHYNMRGELLFASEAMRSMLGYDPAELIGTSGFDRVHPDDRPYVREALKKIAATRNLRTLGITPIGPKSPIGEINVISSHTYT